MALIDFTSEELRQLRRIIRSEMLSIVNTQNLPNQVENAGQSPDVLIAFTPLDGIPALAEVESGTASVVSGDAPGSALCILGRIDRTNEDTVTTLDKEQRVWNLQGTTIPGHTYIAVHRSKFGEWLASTGGGVCASANEIQHLIIYGKPTGGTFVVTLFVPNEAGDQIGENITLNWDDDADETQIALQGHSEISNAGTGTGTGSNGDSLVADIQVSGGPFPNASTKVEFIGDLSNKVISLMLVNFANLTGGIGVGAMILREQKGNP